MVRRASSPEPMSPRMPSLPTRLARRGRFIIGQLKDLTQSLLPGPLSCYNRKLAMAFAYRLPVVVIRGHRWIPAVGHMNDVYARFVLRLLHFYPWVTDVLEIGFNAGHSSYVLLSGRPDIRVLSFDLGEVGAVNVAKRLIDRRFPGRHELILGDSRHTVPAFVHANPGRHFDLIFIDGGHEYDMASSDIANCASLSSPRSLILMDDVVPTRDYGVEPARAWSDAVSTGLVDQLLLIDDGFPLCDVAFPEVRPVGHAWAVGRYRSGWSATRRP